MGIRTVSATSGLPANSRKVHWTECWNNNTPWTSLPTNAPRVDLGSSQKFGPIAIFCASLIHPLTSDIEAHTLIPTTISAVTRQAARTKTLTPARGAVLQGMVVSNVLPKTRPCFRRIPKALPARNSSMPGKASIGTPITYGRTAAMGPLTTTSRGITVAIAAPIASTGSPLDFSSNHACARVGDEVGHGSRNRPASQSVSPDPFVLGIAAGASPRRCRATPATVSANDTRPIEAIRAVSVNEKSSFRSDPPARMLNRAMTGAQQNNDPIHWKTLLRVVHWTKRQAMRKTTINVAIDSNGSVWPKASPSRAAEATYIAAPETASYIMATPTITLVRTGRV